ncbi:unnamed protein product [Camellia sinensis]
MSEQLMKLSKDSYKSEIGEIFSRNKEEGKMKQGFIIFHLSRHLYPPSTSQIYSLFIFLFSFSLSHTHANTHNTSLFSLIYDLVLGLTLDTI